MIIKNLNKNKIKLNITAVYTAKQTQKILENILKNPKLLFLYLRVQMADAGKEIHFLNLKKD